MSQKILEPRVCSVSDCETLSIYLTKGMCQKHYIRMYRKGTIETERSMHGLTGTPEYSVWSAMIQRCTNPKNAQYKWYGARGISVCERWLKFDNFLSDIGNRPSPELEIDRIDNDGNYEPGNVKWSTRKEQMNNMRRNKNYGRRTSPAM